MEAGATKKKITFNTSLRKRELEPQGSCKQRQRGSNQQSGEETQRKDSIENLGEKQRLSQWKKEPELFLVELLGVAPDPSSLDSESGFDLESRVTS